MVWKSWMSFKWPMVCGSSPEHFQSEEKSTLPLHSQAWRVFPTLLSMVTQPQENTVNLSSASRITEGLVLTKQEGKSLIRHWKSLSDRYLSGPRSACKHGRKYQGAVLVIRRKIPYKPFLFKKNLSKYMTINQRRKPQ